MISQIPRYSAGDSINYPYNIFIERVSIEKESLNSMYRKQLPQSDGRRIPEIVR